jgi:8-oxo-dGTP diphosphatase
MNHVPEIQSAHAILLVSGGYALQLRDDKPTISAPGTWSLFGGMIRQGETPMQTIKREIAEELGLEPGQFHPFGFQDYYSDFEKEVIRTWFFSCEVTRLWPGHQLTEGQAAAVFAFEELAGLSMPPVMRQVVTRFHQAPGAGSEPAGGDR